MKQDKSSSVVADEFQELVREFLGLEPSSLAAMDTQHGSTAVGLNIFLRLTLQRATSALWAAESPGVRLQSDGAARALGWGDARTYSLSSLIVWALIQAPRRARGLPYMPLCPADPAITDLSRKPDIGSLWTANESSAAAIALFKADIDAIGDAPMLSLEQSMPICPLVHNLLGIDPKIINRGWHKTRRKADKAFARDPDGQVAAALAAWMLTILEFHRMVLDQNADTITILMLDDKSYRGPTSARYANIGATLLAGLLADNNQPITFLVPNAA